MIKNVLSVSKSILLQLESALKSKDGEVSFLRAHVAQLTKSISQLALPPSQEEARAKHWYQFWK
jgi:hypothetical protein